MNAVPYAQLFDAAKNGSPLLLQALGRLFGLGDNERTELASNGVPTWVLLGGALALGFVVGARVQKAHPTKVPKLISG